MIRTCPGCKTKLEILPGKVFNCLSCGWKETSPAPTPPKLWYRRRLWYYVSGAIILLLIFFMYIDQSRSKRLRVEQVQVNWTSAQVLSFCGEPDEIGDDPFLPYWRYGKTIFYLGSKKNVAAIDHGK